MTHPDNKHEKGLSANRLTMMALGTVIGGSFFVGSSVAIKSAGPSVLISYILCGIMVYFILFALSEMTVSNTDSGSFRGYASEYVSNGTGFVVGWVYWAGMVITMSSEATAVAVIIQSWFPKASETIIGSCLIIAVTLLNMLGARQLSRLESILAAIKLFAIFAFIILGAIMIIGLFPHISTVGLSVLSAEPLMPGGIKNLFGSLLLVFFAYSGFEVIGLAASETANPQRTVPKAIHQTVLILVSLYIIAVFILILLVPTSLLSDDSSPFVTALQYYNLGWAMTVFNLILIVAIVSTMLASVFGIARMLRSLADDKMAPSILRDTKEVPYRGILFSGACMLGALYVGMIFPQAYVFLISSGGFSVLFTYIILMITHICYRKKNGFESDSCHLRGFPYSSAFTLVGLFLAVFSMPFIKDQTAGFFAGLLLVLFFTVCYGIVKYIRLRNFKKKNNFN